MTEQLKNGTKKEPLFSLTILYLIAVCAVYILPYFKFVVPYMIAAPLMLATLLPLLFKKTPWTPHAIFLCIIFLSLALIGTLTSPLSPVAAANEMVKNVRFFLPAFWGCYVLKYVSKKQQTVLIIFFAAVCLFMLIRTLIALEIEPEIARALAQSKVNADAEITEYRLQNVGGFEFSYMMGIVALCLTYSAIKVKNTWLRILSALGVIVIFYYIIQTMYTLLLLLTFATVCLLLFFNIKKPVVKVLLVVAAVVFVVAIPGIVKFLSTAFEEGSILNYKFANIYKAIVSEDATEMGSRPELIARAFDSWLEAPLFGRSNKDSNSHSLIMMTLESGGLVAFSGWLLCIITAHQALVHELRKMKVNSVLLSVAFIYVVALAFFNPIGYVFEITIAAFLFVPIWCLVFKRTEEDV